jgi:TonB family protein
MIRISGVGWTAIVLLGFATAAPIWAQVQPLHRHEDSTPNDPVDGVYKVGHGVKPPRGTYMPDPEYSEPARRIGYQGTCVLELVVDAEGMPGSIKVTRPIGMGLDEKALEAVRRWRFSPATKDGSPVAVHINVEVSFRLYGQGNRISLYEKANAGEAKAQFEVAKILLSDRPSSEDFTTAFGFLEKAAKQNLAPAQFAMGEYFSTRKNDLVSAYVWYVAARKNRYKKSDQKLKELADKMTPDQLAEARRQEESVSPH